MVSLINSASQFILAEATRSYSATSDPPKDGDELWLGSTILARADAMCEHCFTNMCSAKEDDGRCYTTKGLIVNDCRLDKRFSHREYVTAKPGLRFYAGVPLYARNGVMIGTVAVSDDDPRDGLHAGQLRLLQETAQNVMEHLEWARDRVDRFKGERIVRGMASFIEDCSYTREATPEHDTHPEQVPESRLSASRRPRSRASYRPSLVSRNSARRINQQQAEGPKMDAMSRIFAVAADILRDSNLADGAAIFGATADASRKTNLRSMPGNLNGVTTHAGASMLGQSATSSDSERYDTNTSDSDSGPAARPCKILAFSVADDQARSDIENGTALTLATLERYFSMYPLGKTFSFNEQGAGISSEEESDAATSGRESEDQAGGGDDRESTARMRNRKRRMDHRELLKKIPGANTVIFLPLYDQTEEKLIAGCFLWTSVTGRMLQDGDLSYLRAFGNCVVTQVIRENMRRNEAAKTTFIASMSHELRSPLHGILGAAEFLMDTTTDAYQSGLVTSIVTCGKTLLDTLNHVLDYSKINKLGRTTMRRRAKANKPINLASDSSLDSLNMTADIDLGILVEEVAEAITAGHTFKKVPGANVLATASTTAAGTSESYDSLTSARSETASHVPVLLDISPRRSWNVRIQPGALRRIIMNLLGNALKYTSSGFVAVSLRAQESADMSRTKALIRVVDSGKGMSESFQRDKMFVPFSQEDPFQPGTGLGLSIVKQIVDSLGGSIDVRSEQGVGTEIDIHLTLTPATGEADPKSPVKDVELNAVEEWTRGRHVVLVDPQGKRREPGHPISRLQQTLRELCAGWFRMRVSFATRMDVDDADIYLYCEAPFDLSDGRESWLSSCERPVVVLCTNDHDRVTFIRDHLSIFRESPKIVEVIPQP
jgi:signal transduction histidine kinase